MALNSADSDFSQIVETLNISDGNFKCKDLINYPLELTSTAAANLPERNVPIICGGQNIENETVITNKCYLLDEFGWTATFHMNDKRTHFSAMSRSPYRNESHKMFVLGYTRRAEVLTEKGWEYIGLPTPDLFYLSCMMIIDDSSILVAGIYNKEELYTGTENLLVILASIAHVISLVTKYYFIDIWLKFSSHFMT